MTCTTAADAQARMTAYEQWYDSKDADTQALIDAVPYTHLTLPHKRKV